jgi:hypothetical protein
MSDVLYSLIAEIFAQHLKPALGEFVRSETRYLSTIDIFGFGGIPFLVIVSQLAESQSIGIHHLVTKIVDLFKLIPDKSIGFGSASALLLYLASFAGFVGPANPCIYFISSFLDKARSKSWHFASLLSDRLIPMDRFSRSRFDPAIPKTSRVSIIHNDTREVNLKGETKDAKDINPSTGIDAKSCTRSLLISGSQVRSLHGSSIKSKTCSESSGSLSFLSRIHPGIKSWKRSVKIALTAGIGLALSDAVSIFGTIILPGSSR